MTTDDIKKRIEKIKAFMADYERAHGEEDDLRADVLRVIAAGAPNAAELAAAVLQTEELDFPRYCA